MATPSTRKWALLWALRNGGKRNSELCDVVDDCAAYIPRDMAKLREKGLVRSTPIKGHGDKGRKALYTLTAAGLAAIGRGAA